MYALLVWRREVDEHVREYLFEARQMTCFNGLNRERAFAAPVGSSQGFSVKWNKQSNTLVMRGGGHVDHDDSINVGYTWSCLGLGWVADAMVNFEPNVIRGGQAACNDLRCDLATFLTQEHILMQYNQWRAEKQPTRPFTPNEAEIRRVLGAITRVSQPISNSLGQALSSASVYAYLGFDIVGSERSSGFAVAYLQVFRNTARHALSVEGRNDQLRNVLYRLFMNNDWGHVFKSNIPLLSLMFNHGDDSDIFSFTNSFDCLFQGTKYGIFSLEQFFRDRRPMTEEGFYRKGGQSAHLSQTIVRKADSHGVTINAALNVKLDAYKQLRSNILSLSNVATAYNIWIGTEQDNLRNYQRLAGEIRKVNLDTLKESLRSHLSTYPDLRTNPQVQSTGRPQLTYNEFTLWLSELQDIVH